MTKKKCKMDEVYYLKNRNALEHQGKKKPFSRENGKEENLKILYKGFIHNINEITIFTLFWSTHIIKIGRTSYLVWNNFGCEGSIYMFSSRKKIRGRECAVRAPLVPRSSKPPMRFALMRRNQRFVVRRSARIQQIV